MKRIVSVWLPSFATDRLYRSWRTMTGTLSEAGPPSRRAVLATVAAGKGGLRIVALDAAARALGMRPGMSLADARALSPTLVAVPADPPAERRALSALADWCCRYTPWASIDRDASHPGEFGGGAGLWLDTSGCAHLFGDEETMLRDLLARLEALGFTATATIAETAGAAWAIARFGSERIAVLPAGTAAVALASLPVRGLRLPPEIATALRRTGLRRIGDLLPLPRAPLAARFGDLLLRRLDQALGRLDEPLSPRLPPPAFHARLAFAEPIGRTEDIALALQHLLVDLCARLEAAHKGARRLQLAAFRTDGTVERVAVGTSRPTRGADHLRLLFREKLDRLDPGFGIEVMTLGALVVDPLASSQPSIGLADDAGEAESLAQLVDRLGNRLGPDAVVRLAEHPSHVPERACREVPAMSDLSSPQVPSPQPSPDGRGRRAVRGDCSLPPLPTPDGRGRRAERAGEGKAAVIEDHGSRQPRPLHLLASPEPVEVIAPVPDGPPVLFRWRRTRYLIARCEGPERIGPEWWLTHGGHGAEQLSRIRDYYRVEDNDGLRFWMYREGFYRPDRPPRWYLHGMFG
jgi:protein ImuB